MMMRITVVINGGPNNPYAQFGLTANPFPQVPKREFATMNNMLRELDAEPIKSTDQIRTILSGCDPAFIELCCKKFEPGKRVEFQVEWPDR